MSAILKKYVAILILCVTLLNLGACSLQEKHSDQADALNATVVDIEKYGHAVLSLTTADLLAAGYALGDVVCVRVASYESDMPFFDGYYVNPGEVMLRGSATEKNIAICINYGDFCQNFGIAIGETVEITMVEKARMLALQELCTLQYSDNRAEYSDDTAFANFRAVTNGNIGDGKLYRSASPINNKHGRAAYANALVAQANVATILNLADSTEDIEAYFAEEGFTSAYYRALYESGAVMALDLAGNFYSESFAASIADGLTFLAQNAAPYGIHCTEGKDRGGFVAMVLSALMGAELEEIIHDYMLSYYHYYGIDKESQPERYEAVLRMNLLPILCHVMGVDSVEALEQADLEACVTAYLLRAGMREADIITLQEKLR